MPRFCKSLAPSIVSLQTFDLVPHMLLSLLVSLAFITTPGRAPAQRWCSEPAIAAWPLGGIREVLKGNAIERERMYALPALPPDSAIVVTDERVCERAARTYYRYRLGPIPPGGVAVVRVGNRYAVYGANRAGEWTILTIYSDRFEYITSIAM